MILLSSKCERKFKSPMPWIERRYDPQYLANQRAEHVVVTKLPRRLPGFLGCFHGGSGGARNLFALIAVRVNYQLQQGKKTPGSLCSDPGIPIVSRRQIKLA